VTLILHPHNRTNECSVARPSELGHQSIIVSATEQLPLQISWSRLCCRRLDHDAGESQVSDPVVTSVELREGSHGASSGAIESSKGIYEVLAASLRSTGFPQIQILRCGRPTCSGSRGVSYGHIPPLSFFCTVISIAAMRLQLYKGHSYSVSRDMGRGTDLMVIIAVSLVGLLCITSSLWIRGCEKSHHLVEESWMNSSDFWGDGWLNWELGVQYAIGFYELISEASAWYLEQKSLFGNVPILCRWCDFVNVYATSDKCKTHVNMLCNGSRCHAPKCDA